MNKWIIITPTICQGNIPAWFGSEGDEEERPIVFDTEKEAALYMLEERITKLACQLEELKGDYIQADDIEWDEEDFIVSCFIDEEGIIHTSEGVLYNPKTYVR